MTRIRLIPLFTGLLLSVQASYAQPTGALVPSRLRCESLENPIGLDVEHPRFSWVDSATERGQKQSAYQILVSSSAAKLAANQADIWNSGKVSSDVTTNVPYEGRTLTSGQMGYWKVRVWDANGKPAGVSEPATFEMGLLSQKDWGGDWIARTDDINELPAPMFRHEFRVSGKVKSARLYICGLGYHEVELNGSKVGDRFLDPGFTRYDRCILYVTHDVTDQIKDGENAIGVTLGNGWFNSQTIAVWNLEKAPWRAAPKMILKLEVDYTDGRKSVLVSDKTWKTSTGPIVFDSIYGGEIYDARLEKSGWSTAGYDDSKWDEVKIVKAPTDNMVAQAMPPIRATATIKPVKITEPKPGVFIFDMGQNFAGHVNLTVSGPAGTSIKMRYAELLHGDGTLDNDDMSKHVRRGGADQAFQTDTYILKGEGTEKWHSRFSYYGFQYVEVTGFPGKPTLESLEGVFIHSDVEKIGQFECSNPLFNWITEAARWSYLSNLYGLPTDCPHREKNGWTADAHIAAEQALYTFDPITIYAKWMNDIADEQRPDGNMPGIIPNAGWGDNIGPAWDSAFLIIPDYINTYCGDSSILRDHYEGMKRYVDFLGTRAENGIVSYGLNDWAPASTKTPADITSTGYYYQDARIVAHTAELLGKSGEAKKYNRLADDIKKDFNKKFYNAETGLYGNGSQAALSCALYHDLVDPENKQRVFDHLLAAIEKSNGHIDAGILGTKYIFRVLTAGGRADVAYAMADKKDAPGWGWWKAQGATTLWEQWNGTESHNHIMFGDIVAWFYESLAGIGADPAQPGFKHIIVRPQPVGDLTYAKGVMESVQGKIESSWKIEGDQFKLHLLIPPNSTATVYITGAKMDEVMEGNSIAAKAAGIRSAKQEKGAAVFEIESGSYDFTAPKAIAGE
ncbi:glycoside hydrolase family 78 protein [Luteolibacter pohnpeiensis]|nr:glycoside hydrolase family 78 protein [Luteolibacter pohnpeiensis]